ncbi:hypothetical protein G5V58_12295 [Nocardioides anomalus]|uniref:Uncharacterized protein n=1 Tax=Nocardioides anomalus TaxID=2712223 RepID=A0A6G6WEH6_9ACTN|nr:hypothetical protein [Nocardioides anomalus]QIG43440.1 hypothetical protein G5V58_12295 [Nocardioides anomalus]
MLALLAPLLLLLPGGSAQAQGLVRYRHVPAVLVGDLAVGMPNERTVQVQHLDRTTGQWDAPTTVLRTRGAVTCGDLDARAAGGGVAVLVECDTPYYEDQAPVRSVALVSRDGYAWARHRLPGEAYGAPALSPSATYAAWPLGGIGSYLEWSAATGFGEPATTTYRSDVGDRTVVVDDAGTVTVLGTEQTRRHCFLGVHSRDLSGATAQSRVPLGTGCGDGNVTHVDANTVLAGGYEPATQVTVSRTGPGGTWAITAPAPADQPGLVVYGYGRKRVPTHYVYSPTPGAPVVALGSPDRLRVLAQVYDPTTRTWGAQTLAYTSGRPCQVGYEEPQARPGQYADRLECGRRTVTLRSPDGVTWTVRR